MANDVDGFEGPFGDHLLIGEGFLQVERVGNFLAFDVATQDRRHFFAGDHLIGLKGIVFVTFDDFVVRCPDNGIFIPFSGFYVSEGICCSLLNILSFDAGQDGNEHASGNGAVRSKSGVAYAFKEAFFRCGKNEFFCPVALNVRKGIGCRRRFDGFFFALGFDHDAAFNLRVHVLVFSQVFFQYFRVHAVVAELFALGEHGVAVAAACHKVVGG